LIEKAGYWGCLKEKENGILPLILSCRKLSGNFGKKTGSMNLSSATGTGLLQGIHESRIGSKSD
jgi:hypothetical protein